MGEPRLIVRCDRSAPVVSLQVWVDVGAADERAGEYGVCHLIEHMLFRGSASLAPGELAERLESGGGAVNAFTSPDQTVVTAVCASRFLAEAVAPLADAVLRPNFDPDILEAERAVVLEELRRDEDAPGRILGRAVTGTALVAHPYGRPVAGTPETVAGLGADRLRAFHQRWFRPDRITVVAVGDLDEDAARRQLLAAFTASPDGEPGRRERTPEPEQRAPRTVLCHGPFEAARLELALPGPAVGDPDTPLLDLLMMTLGQGRASRLNRDLRLERRLLDGFSAGAWSPVDPGMVEISGLTSPDRALPAIRAIIAELRRLATEPITSTELLRAQVCVEAERDYELESMDGQARALGYWAVAAGAPAAEERYRQAIRDATPDGVLDLARRLFLPERTTTGLLLPDGVPIDEAALQDAVAAAWRDELPERSPGMVVPTAAPLPPPPPRRPRGEPPGPAVERQLPCGARLRVEPRRSAPIVAIRLLLPGGLRAETEPSGGLFGLLTRCWTRGTQRRDSHALALAAEGLATSISGIAGWSTFGLGASFPSRFTDPALRLFEEILCEASFPDGPCEEERSLALQAVLRERESPGAVAFRTFAGARYGEHPWARSSVGTEESLGALTPDLLRDCVARRLRRDDAVLAVVGDVDAEATADRLTDLLQRLPTGAGPEVNVAAPPTRDQPTRVRVDLPRAQAHLIVGFDGLRVGDPDAAALDLLHALLGGQSGRLFRQLRDEQGLAYQVGTIGAAGADPGWFAVHLATEPGRVEVARQAVHDELGRLLEDGVLPDELDRCRRRLQGSWEIGRQSYGAMADARVSDAVHGLGWLHSDRWCERLDDVGVEDLQRVVRRIIDLSRVIEVVVGPPDPDGDRA